MATTTPKPRVYIVRPKGEGKPRLVRALSSGAALKHVVDDTLSVDYASQDDIISVMREHPDTVLEDVGAGGGNPSTN